MRPPPSTNCRCPHIAGIRLLVTKSTSAARFRCSRVSTPACTKRAWARSRVIAAKAPSNSLGARSSSGCTVRRRVGADSCICFNISTLERRAKLLMSPAHGVSNNGKYDGDRAGGLLGGHRRWRISGDDDVHLEAGELSCQLGQAFGLGTCESVLRGHGLAFFVGDLTSPFPQTRGFC